MILSIEQVIKCFGEVCIMSEFTPKEKYWYDKIVATKASMEEYSKDVNTSKSDINFMNSYIRLMELSLKYENLRPSEHMTICKRLVRVYKTLTPYELKKHLTEFVLLDGLYIVTDVMFIDYHIYKEYIEYPVESMRLSLGLPDDLQCGTLKPVRIDNIEYGVGLMKTPLVCEYVLTPSNWDYPIWE